MQVIEGVMVPGSWDEVTFSQLMALGELKGADPANILAVLVNASPASIDAATKPRLIEAFAKCLEFVEIPPAWDKLPKPSRLVIDGKPVKLPAGVQSEAFGQKVLLSQLLGDDFGLGAILEAVTIYIEPKISGKAFNRENLEAVRAQVAECGAPQVYGAGAFFLTRRLNLTRIIAGVGGNTQTRRGRGHGQARKSRAFRGPGANGHH